MRIAVISMEDITAMKGTFKIKGIFGSGMVLQRNKINCVYGTAEVYSDVIMEFRGTTSITQADEDGKWKLALHDFKTNAKILREFLYNE